MGHVGNDRDRASNVKSKGTMPAFEIEINGRSRRVDAPADMPLLWALRDALHLTGAKYSCGRGLCGACTVLVDGRPTASCLLPLGQVGNASVTTIEGLSADGSHPVQRAWKELGVPQCGYCQCGQILRAAALLANTPQPDAGEIRRGMNPCLCRCGTYLRIEAAVRRAAQLAAGP